MANFFPRCPTCPGTHRCVLPDGPEECDILFIGERPGGDENKFGRPFIGKAGREFNDNYLFLAGLRRDIGEDSDIRITNTVLCGADGNRKPTEKEIWGCADHHLPHEIKRCNPSIIVLLGGTACSLIPGINLDIEHGIPRHGHLYDWDGIVVPMYHPAAGLHDTGKMIPLLEDFERLGRALKGDWSQPDDPYPIPDYQLITTQADWNAFIHGNQFPFGFSGGERLIAVDTERHGENKYSVQWSTYPGTGNMLLCSHEVLDKVKGGAFGLWGQTRDWFRRMQDSYGWEIVLHNAPQDLDWLDRMGIRVNRFRDTMQEAYHLGNLPQGLKGLAYRLLGIRMTTYEDVVIPHSRRAMIDWLSGALDHSRESLQRIEEIQLKTKIKKVTKPSEMERGLSRILKHTLFSDTYDPWKKLDELVIKGMAKGVAEFTDAEKVFVEACGFASPAQAVVNKLTGHPGRTPIVGIGNVPLDEVVRYGCADADMTLRVALELKKRRGALVGEGGEWEVAEGDEDQ